MEDKIQSFVWVRRLSKKLNGGKCCCFLLGLLDLLVMKYCKFLDMLKYSLIWKICMKTSKACLLMFSVFSCNNFWLIPSWTFQLVFNTFTFLTCFIWHQIVLLLVFCSCIQFLHALGLGSLFDIMIHCLPIWFPAIVYTGIMPSHHISHKLCIG